MPLLPAPIPGFTGANQYLELLQESTWGTFDSAATIKFWGEIEDGAFSIDRKSLVKKAKAATQNISNRQVASRYEVTASYKGKLYYDVAKIIIPWAWTPYTIGPRKYLRSFSANYFDGITARRFLGGRFEEMNITSSSDEDWVYFDAKIRFRGEDSTVPVMSEPNANLMPGIEPWHHIDSSGFIKANPAGTIIAGYDSLSAKVANVLDARFDEQPVLSSLDYNGRTVTWDVDMKILDATVRNAIWETQSSSVGFIKWSYTTSGGTPTTYLLTLDMQAANYPETYAPSRPLGKSQYQKLSLEAFLDRTTGIGIDCVATVTP